MTAIENQTGRAARGFAQGWGKARANDLEAAMLQEGILVEDPKMRVKSEMLRALWRLERTTPDEWHRRVYARLFGRGHEDTLAYDRNTRAAYTRWLGTFDGLIAELVDDGYATIEQVDGDEQIVATEASEPPHFSVVPLLARY